jgi:hypothetical protein
LLTKPIVVPADFIDKLTELLAIIEQREYDKLAAFALDVPGKFNWVRDVFEPVVVNRNAGQKMLEMVSAEGEVSTLAYGGGLQQRKSCLREQGN